MDRDLFDEYEGAGHAEFCFQVLITHLWKCMVLKTINSMVFKISLLYAPTISSLTLGEKNSIILDSVLTCAGLTQLLFLIRHLFLSGVVRCGSKKGHQIDMS